MFSLAELATKFALEFEGQSNPAVTGVAISSGFVEPGFLFVAAPGAKNHGLDFLDQAVANGAVAILTDRPGDYPLPTSYHPNPREVAGLIAAETFQSSASTLFGVTGTNGKTSTVTYLQRLLAASGLASGMISSAGQLVGSELRTAELTTPEAPRLHQLLAQMRSQGQFHSAVEVSAQALVRNRVDGLHFAVAGFSNLSRDHLDDFGSMEHYLEAKARLFEPELADAAVINIEDQWAEALFEKIEIPKFAIGAGRDFEFHFDEGLLRISGLKALELRFSGTALMAKNLALAATMLLAHGIEIPNNLAVDSSVPGRLQQVSEITPHVYVDYAHTPAGVAAAVGELAGKYQTLTLVLGASGNRDQGKREEMAQAAKPAALVVITDQHPRDEDPAEIRAALIRGAEAAGISYVEEPDPEQAIAQAIAATPASGAVLWCGPGHLTYREIRGQKVPFDAVSIVRKVQL